jgi:hypothetical protein
MKGLLLLVVIAPWAAPSLTKVVSSDGGGFTLLGLAGDQDTSVPPSSVPGNFLVKGRYVEFTVDSTTFGVGGLTLTGAPSPLDIIGGTNRGLRKQGPYTVLLSGKNNGTGIGVVEVYDRGGTPQPVVDADSF